MSAFTIDGYTVQTCLYIVHVRVSMYYPYNLAFYLPVIGTLVPCFSPSIMVISESLIAPLLMQYSSLSHDYESQVATSTSKEILPNPSALTTSLLRRLESCPVNDRVGIRAQLEMLSFLSPKATLSGLKSFFGVLDFSVGENGIHCTYCSVYIYKNTLTAAEAIEAGNWHPCHDWKSLFGVEVASEVERKSLESVPLTVPLFELTCRLLYREDPKELVNGWLLTCTVYYLHPLF